jgi:hypothetical protein
MREPLIVGAVLPWVGNDLAEQPPGIPALKRLRFGWGWGGRRSGSRRLLLATGSDDLKDPVLASTVVVALRASRFEFEQVSLPAAA